METARQRVVRHGVSRLVSRQIRCGAALSPPLRNPSRALLPPLQILAPYSRHQIEILQGSCVLREVLAVLIMRRAGDEDAPRRRAAAAKAQLPSKSMPHPRGASSSCTVPSNGGFQSSGYSSAGTFFNGSFHSSAGTSFKGFFPSGTASFNGSFPSGATSFPYGGNGNGRGSGSPISPPTIVAPWGQDSRPPRGFMSYFNNPFTPPTTALGSPVATTSNKFIDLDKNDCSDKGGNSVPANDDVRTDKRLLWKEDEDYRLMSAWLKHSIDPRNGTNKNSEKYWGDVASEYDMTTPQNRKRNVKQVKERWHKSNKWINWFNDAWIKVRGIYTSGYSNDVWIEKAHRMYEEDHAGARFVLMDVWKLCRDEAKWIIYNTQNKNVKKRKEGEKGEDTEKDDEKEVDLPRPIGQKAAKRAAAVGVQGKNKATAIDVDALDRFEKIQSNNHTNRLKLLEMQQQLSGKKEKTAKIDLLSAKEQKSAKMVEKEIKMLETYNNLLMQNTAEMTDEVRSAHVLALKCLRKSLFPDS